MGEVVEALREAVDGDAAGDVDGVSAPVVVSYQLREILHFFDEAWDEVSFQWRSRCAAVESCF